MKKINDYIYEKLNENDEKTILLHKKKQLDIILKNNPAKDDYTYHTWIRSIDDILTYKEAIEKDEVENEGITPDFNAKDIKNAINSGKIKIYSSKEIKPGIFVTPSKMEAKNYAGSGMVYDKEVKLEDVAWIDSLQGQYAKVN